MLRAKLDRPLKDLYNGKGPGVDKISVELLRSAVNEILDYLFNVLSNIYKSGDLPTDFMKIAVALILKKKKAEKFQQYRTIS